MLSDLYNSVANVGFTKPEWKLFPFLNTCWSMLTKAFCFYFVFVVVFFVCLFLCVKKYLLPSQMCLGTWQ